MGSGRDVAGGNLPTTTLAFLTLLAFKPLAGLAPDDARDPAAYEATCFVIHCSMGEPSPAGNVLGVLG